MIASLNIFHYHIIDVYLHVLPYLVGEDNIHKALVGGASVLEAKGYDIILVVSMI